MINKENTPEKIQTFFEHKISHVVVVSLFFFFTISSIVFLFWYGYKNNNELSSKISQLSEDITKLEAKLASTTTALSENIIKTQISLTENITKGKQDLESRLSNVQNEVGSVSGTVNTLEKLSKTDPELLQKYSKIFFLNEHFAPSRLTEIPKEYTYYENRSYQVYDKIYPYLQRMLNSAKNNGIDLYTYSAYRSFENQQALKGIYTVTYGSGAANQFSADQGYSEHQLGTTVDLITTGIGGSLKGFGETKAFDWLTQNAHKYGFVLSYPKDNDYYIYEPWHWRFVGVNLATYLKNNNKYFYDLDQREIDEYLISIFD